MRSEDFATPADQLPRVSPLASELSTDEDWDAPTYQDFQRLMLQVWPDATFTDDDDYWIASSKSPSHVLVVMAHGGGTRYWEIDMGRDDATAAFNADFASRPTLPAALEALEHQYKRQAVVCTAAASHVASLRDRAARGVITGEGGDR